MALGLWSGKVILYDLDQGKVIGRIHTVGASSLTQVKYSFINNKPFIITGHANGEIAWYSAKCGTLTAFTHANQHAVENFVNLKETLYTVSKDSVEIWENKGVAQTKAIVEARSDHENSVLAIFKILDGYFIVYKYGYVAIFDENFIMVQKSRVSSDGFSNVTIVNEKSKKTSFIVILPDGNLAKIEICLHETNIIKFFQYDILASTSAKIFAWISESSVWKRFFIFVSNGPNTAIDVYQTKRIDLEKPNFEKTQLSCSLIGIHFLQESSLNQKIFHVGKFFVNTLDESKLTKPSTGKKYINKIGLSASNEETGNDFRLALGFENTQIMILNGNLEEVRSLKPDQSLVAIHMISDLIFTASLDEVRIWSKKKSETIASKSCQISSRFGLLPIKRKARFSKQKKRTFNFFDIILCHVL